MSSGPDEDHYWLVADRILDGSVIPFLGAGANLAERPDKTSWRKGQYLPSGAELAKALADRTRYPEPADDLLRVAQYVDAMLGEGTLYQYLRATFNADYPPNCLHTLLASLPRILRERKSRYQMIVTTNYDDALERAFDAAQEQYDLLWYEAKRTDAHGKFVHQAPGMPPRVVELPNEDDRLSLEQRTTILKLHGAVHRTNRHADSYVITEDDYIEYLSRPDISAQIPVTLREAMTECHFLFLGYSMRDWNLRVVLNRLWGEAELGFKSWAVQLAHDNPKRNDVERKLWSSRGDVELLLLPLREYVEQLRKRLLDLTEPDKVAV